MGFVCNPNGYQLGTLCLVVVILRLEVRELQSGKYIATMRLFDFLQGCL